MADDIEVLGKLLIQTIKLLRKLDTDFDKDPLKNFDYAEKLRDNLERMAEINSNDEIFEEDRDYSELLERLGKFIDVTEDYRTRDDSPFKESLNLDKVLRILVDLDKRYDSIESRQ